MKTVAVLFARDDSVYKEFPAADVFDQARDALTYAGGLPVVAHPPCRSWGSLRHVAKPAPGEKELAPWAVAQVRKWGGVLEHPAFSKLWPTLGLPAPGAPADRYGGRTVEVSQWWFGHRADKRTWLYICGYAGEELPPFPIRLGRPSHVIAGHGRDDATGQRIRKGDPRWRPVVPKAEREGTPRAFAIWLVSIALQTTPGGVADQPGVMPPHPDAAPWKHP